MSKYSPKLINLAERGIERRIELSLKSEIGKKLNSAISSIYKSGRLELLKKTRAAIAGEAPAWSVPVFAKLKSEKREFGKPHVGAGLVTRNVKNAITLTFYANDQDYPPGSPRFGSNQHWAIQTAIKGRGPRRARFAKALAIPATEERKRGRMGWANVRFVKAVGPVEVPKGWFDRAVQQLADELI
jgi:hypothetical protein